MHIHASVSLMMEIDFCAAFLLMTTRPDKNLIAYLKKGFATANEQTFSIIMDNTQNSVYQCHNPHPTQLSKAKQKAMKDCLD